MEISPAINELQLLERLRAGEEAAFNALYTIYAPSLVSFAAARLTSLSEAEDIIHDLFVQVWNDREHLNINISFRAFLFAATRYRIIDHIRKSSSRKKYAEAIAKMPIHAQEETENRIFEKELREKLESALNQLTPRTKEVFKLSRFEHLTVSEIAQRMNVSEQTVKNQLTTALSQLRSLLGKVMFVLWWL